MTDDRPHVVLLMADHLRRDCLSCYGDVAVRTPHLDALAEESIVFEQAYCATPLCGPTRVSMYTGKWPHVHGAIVNGEAGHAHAGPAHRTLYEMLAEAGYGITHTGVNHCRVEPRIQERVPAAAFDGPGDSWSAYARERGIEPSNHRVPEVLPLRIPVLAGDGEQPLVRQFHLPRGVRYERPADDFMDLFWSRRAVAKIEALDPGRPQYFEALFWAPHPPLVVPEPYFSMYPPEDIELPPTVGRWCDGQPPSLLRQTCGQLGHTLTREEYRGSWSAYFGLVTMVDECIGRVVQALKARGIWDDALVVFTQDHGEMLGCHHLFQKHCCYEEAAHIPLLVKPPGGGTGRRAQLASAVDYCPTICAYAGIEPPRDIAGRSLRPAVEDAGAPGRDATFVQYNGDITRSTPMRAIVAEAGGRRMKYIYTQGDIDELYDLGDDPMEMTSLAREPEWQPVLRELRRRLAQWMRDTGDFIAIEDA